MKLDQEQFEAWLASPLTMDEYERWSLRQKQEQEAFGDANPPTNYGTYAEGVMAERQRIVNLLMIQHEAAKGVHNYWHVAANLIQAEVASDT